MSWLLHLVLTVVGVAWMAEGSPGPSVEEAHATAESRPPLVVVRALGPVPRQQLRAACRVVLAEYPVRCVVRATRALTEAHDAWDPEREQLDARTTLDRLFETRSQDAVVELDVTTLDLFEEGKPYVFGLASLPDRTALISTARLVDDEARTDARLATLVRHEFGHAIGLHHHDVPGCVMRQDATVASLDEAPDGPCVRCREELAERIVVLGRAGQPALDRARGLLLRGRRDEARSTLVDALWSHSLDAELLDAFARVFFEAGQYNEAISLLRHTLDQQPSRAASHVQLGLAYQRRARRGDLARAVDCFEQAVALRPDWDSVVDHLAATRAELSAQGPHHDR